MMHLRLPINRYTLSPLSHGKKAEQFSFIKIGAWVASSAFEAHPHVAPSLFLGKG